VAPREARDRDRGRPIPQLMKLLAMAILLVGGARAFRPATLLPRTRALARPHSTAIMSATATDTVVAPELTGQSAAFLRDAGLTGANGQATKLDDVMGTGKSVVVFLRHLG